MPPIANHNVIFAYIFIIISIVTVVNYIVIYESFVQDENYCTFERIHLLSALEKRALNYRQHLLRISGIGALPKRNIQKLLQIYKIRVFS